MVPVLRGKSPIAESASAECGQLRRTSLVRPAMSFQSRSAVWTDDPKILDPVVVADAVDVVKDQADSLAVPELALPAQFALLPLESLLIQAALQIAPTVDRTLNKNLCQRDLRVVSTKCLNARSVWVKVLHRNTPPVCPFPQGSRVGAGVAVPKPAQCFSP